MLPAVACAPSMSELPTVWEAVVDDRPLVSSWGRRSHGVEIPQVAVGSDFVEHPCTRTPHKGGTWSLDTAVVAERKEHQYRFDSVVICRKQYRGEDDLPHMFVVCCFVGWGGGQRYHRTGPGDGCLCLRWERWKRHLAFVLGDGPWGWLCVKGAATKIDATVQDMLQVMITLRPPGGGGRMTWHAWSMNAARHLLTREGWVPLAQQVFKPARSGLEPLLSAG